MTSGHKHREVRINPSTRLGGALNAWMRKPRWHRTNLAKVDASPYPYGPCRDHEQECWYLSILGVLHRWTGFTIVVPDD